MCVSHVDGDWCELEISLLRFSDPICHSGKCTQDCLSLTKANSLSPGLLAVCSRLNEGFLLTPTGSLGCLCQFLVLSLFILMYSRQTSPPEFLFDTTFPWRLLQPEQTWVFWFFFSHKRNKRRLATCWFCLRKPKEQKAERFETQPFQVVHFATGHRKIYFMVLVKTRLDPQKGPFWAYSLGSHLPPDLRFARIRFPQI